MIAIPSQPQVPESQHSSAEVRLRYEDISQDGRLTMHGMPHALGEVFWRQAAPRSGIGDELRDRGVAHFDEQKMVRVIQNLTRNAAEAIGGRGGACRLVVDRDEEGGVVIQGEDDAVVPVLLTNQLAERLCEIGDEVEYEVFSGFGHDDSTRMNIADMLAWTAARFAGEPAATTCAE